MSNLPFIDVHTHNKECPPGVISVYNHMPNEGEYDNKGQLFSVGIHPWFINHNISEQKQIVELLSNKENCIAIGETGIDLSYKTNVKEQETIFLYQINIANQLHKPLMLHLVKAWNPFIEILKKQEINVPIIFHNYRGSAQITIDLLNHNCFYSFGKSLLQESPKLIEVFKQIPLERIFLETDTSTENIEDIYKQVCILREISMESLKKQIIKNYNLVFDKEL